MNHFFLKTKEINQKQKSAVIWFDEKWFGYHIGPVLSIMCLITL